jgi:hypothetical protein
LHPLGIFSSKGPAKGAVTTLLGSPNFKKMVSLCQCGVEVQQGGFTSVPDVLFLLNDDLSIKFDQTAFTEIGWQSEEVLDSIGGNWESGSEVVSNVSSRSTTNSLVRFADHMVKHFGAVTLSRFLAHSALEFIVVVHSMLAEFNGLPHNG